MSQKSTPRLLIVTGIYPPDIGGPASYAQVLARSWSEQQTVSLVTYSSVWSWPEDKKNKFKVKRVWKKWPWLVRHFLYAWKVFWQAKDHELILSLSILNGGLSSWVAARFFKKKFWLRVPGDYVWQMAVLKGQTHWLIDDFQKEKKTKGVGWRWRLQSWVVKRADGLIVPSEYLARLVRGWGASPDKIKVVYNGVDFVPSALTQEEARKQIGIAGNLILSVGRLVPWKGFRMLIKIMPQLLKINQFFRLVIVGDGPERKPLAAMIKNLHLEKKVYLVGSKNPQELAVYLAASEIFTLHTGYEGFSHQILEAMTAGLPVITTAIGGNREVIHQGENGFMVRYNDEFNLIEAIKTTWQTPELRQRFIARGKETAEYFSVEKMLNKTMAILNS